MESKDTITDGEHSLGKPHNGNTTSNAMTPPKLATHMLFSANKDTDGKIERNK
jgi:hypothetical protein